MRATSESLGRELLRHELEKRCRQNPQYSLRAFARSLGIGHSILSLVLSGKRELSEKSAKRFAHRLGLNPTQQRAMVEAANLRNRRNRMSARGSTPLEEQYERITLDKFTVISEWQYYAILSLLELNEARADYRWISRRLGIGETQAKLAFERLARLGLIAKGRNGRWKQSGRPITVDNAQSTAATRSYYKGLLKKAELSIDEVSIHDRDMSSMTLAMRASQLDYARERIRGFRRQLTAELEAQGSADSVFELMIQFFPSPNHRK